MIYLVKLDSAYKIGYTSELKKRINSYKTSCINVELISFREGNMNNEKELHSVLNDYNIRNELYEINDDVKNLFETFVFDSQIDYKKELDKLKKEYDKLKEENLILKKEKYKTDSEIKPYLIKTKELLKNGKIIEIKILYYETYIMFGDLLFYKLETQNFQDNYGKIAKIYNIGGTEMYYVKSGLALPLLELKNLIENKQNEIQL